MTNSEKTKKYVSIAVFCAVAYICTLVFRIKVSFLTFDIKDSIITVGALFFGPMAGAVISLVAALLELTVSDTGLYGFIMNFVSSAIFALVPAACYKYRKNLTTAIFGLTIGVVYDGGHADNESADNSILYGGGKIASCLPYPYASSSLQPYQGCIQRSLYRRFIQTDI